MILDQTEWIRRPGHSAHAAGRARGAMHACGDPLHSPDFKECVRRRRRPRRAPRVSYAARIVPRRAVRVSYRLDAIRLYSRGSGRPYIASQCSMAALFARRAVSVRVSGSLAGVAVASCYGVYTQQRLRQPSAAAASAGAPGAGVTTVDGKTVPLPRNVSMTCGANCGGLSKLRIIDMEEGRANVDFEAARGFFACYHRCIASRKAVAVAERAATVEESVLDVEGVGPGVSPWWVTENARELQGRRAVWRVVLATARRRGDSAGDTEVEVHEAKVPGRIVTSSLGARSASHSRGESGFAAFNRPTDGSDGFEAVFAPDNGDGRALVDLSGSSISIDARALAWEQHGRSESCSNAGVTGAVIVRVSAQQGGEIVSVSADGVATDDPVEAALVRMQQRLPSCG